MPITETIKKGQIKRKTGENSVEILRPETEASLVIYDDNQSIVPVIDSKVADVKVGTTAANATTVVNGSHEAILLTNSAYDASNNKLATMADVGSNVTLVDTAGSESITVGNVGPVTIATRDTAQTISGVKTFTSTNTNFTKDIRFYPGTTGAGVPSFSVGIDTNTDFIIGGNSSNTSALGKIYLGAKGDGYNYISVKPTMAGWDHHIEFQDGAYKSTLPGAGVGYVKYKFPTYDKAESDSTPTYTIATTADIPEVPITGVTDGLFDLNIDANKKLSVSAYSSKGAGHFDTGSTNPSNTNRLNYDGYLYATKLYSGGSEVLTSHLYRPVGLDGTTKLANNSSTQLNFLNLSGNNVVFTWDTTANGLAANVDLSNYVTAAADLTANKIVLGDGNKTTKASSYGIHTTFSASDNANLSTDKAIATYLGNNYQPKDADLTAIAAVTGTGFLKRTGNDTWILDTLTGAMTFVGVSTTDPTSASGATVDQHTTWKKGEVVLYKRTGETGYEEYIATADDNAHWELLGDADSYALKSITINGDGTYITGGGDLSANRTLSHKTYEAATAAAVKIGRDTGGHVVIGGALIYSDVGAAAASHAHGNITSDGKITSTAVSSATGVLVYDSNNKIQRVTAATARSIIGAADDDNVIHKGTSSTNPAPAEARYGDLTIYGTGSAMSNLKVTKDAVSAGSPGGGGMIPMRASKFVTYDEGAEYLSDKATYDATKITFRKNNSGTFTAYDLAFPTKSGTIALTSDIDDLLSNSLAPEYSSSSTYELGEKVIHDGQLYKCSTRIQSAEAWNSAHWTAIKVSSGFVDLDTTQDITGIKTFKNGIKLGPDGSSSSRQGTLNGNDTGHILTWTAGDSGPAKIALASSTHGTVALGCEVDGTEIGNLTITKIGGASGTAYLKFPMVGTSSAYKTIATTDDLIGFVTGPASASVGNIATYNNANGKVIKDSGWEASETSLAYGHTGLFIRSTNPFGDIAADTSVGLGTVDSARVWLARTDASDVDVCTLYPDDDAKDDLGFKNETATKRWRDLYLSGSLKDGTNSITIANIIAGATTNVKSGIRPPHGTESGNQDITGSKAGTVITLGESGVATKWESGVNFATYSAVQVNKQGIVVGGGQMLDVIAHGGTPNVVTGGWYFEEMATA